MYVIHLNKIAWKPVILFLDIQDSTILKNQKKKDVSIK